jgi:tRNA G18 (ribose-2'-O)-methylase SpoU
VSSKILEISDKIVMIPMLGNKESLNVSVAAGIVMYATV